MGSSLRSILPTLLLVRHAMAAATTIGAIVLALLFPASSLADSEATTNPATSITFTSAVLNGVADPSSSDAVYTFQYGTTTAYGQSTPAKSASSGPHDVSETITQLNPATTYHFRLVVADNSYGTTYHLGQDLTFTTPALNAVATTGSATSVTNHAALLNGVVNTTNSDSAWAFQYGETSSYGQATTPQPVGAGVTAVSAQVTGLKPHTTYHFRLVVVQGHPGVGSAGVDVKFRTSAHPFGVVSLRRTKLRIRHGRLSIPLKCSGP